MLLWKLLKNAHTILSLFSYGVRMFSLFANKTNNKKIIMFSNILTKINSILNNINVK